MLYYVYFEEAGVAKTGLSLTWEYFVTAENGTAKAGPSFAEVAGGWYKFDVRFGTSPWDVMTEDLLGVIDGSSTMSGSDRYKPVCITKRGLALAKLGHDGSQDRTTGVTTMTGVDGATNEFGISLASLSLGFDSGGATEIIVGNTITGATSTATGVIAHKIESDSDWAGGNGAGTFYLSSVSGTFQNNENLNVGASSNLATVDGTLGTATNYKYTKAP
jgi:hypothetical protein